MSIDSSRRFKFLKVNNNSKQAKTVYHISARWGLALVKPPDFKRLIPVFCLCYFRRKWRLAQQNSCIRNVLNSVNNAAIHPWDYSPFVSIMPKNNTFTHQIFTGIRTSLRLS